MKRVLLTIVCCITVSLALYGCSKPIPMPDVTGMKITDAEKTLSQAVINTDKVKYIDQGSMAVSLNTINTDDWVVIEQTPTKGQEVEEDTEIKVTVAKLESIFSDYVYPGVKSGDCDAYDALPVLDTAKLYGITTSFSQDKKDVTDVVTNAPTEYIITKMLSYDSGAVSYEVEKKSVINDAIAVAEKKQKEKEEKQRQEEEKKRKAEEKLEKIEEKLDSYVDEKAPKAIKYIESIGYNYKIYDVEMAEVNEEYYDSSDEEDSEFTDIWNQPVHDRKYTLEDYQNSWIIEDITVNHKKKLVKIYARDNGDWLEIEYGSPDDGWR